MKSLLPDPMRGQCSGPIIDCDGEFKVWLLSCNTQNIAAYVSGWNGDRGEQHTEGNFCCPADDKQMEGAGQIQTGVSWRLESHKDSGMEPWHSLDDERMGFLYGASHVDSAPKIGQGEMSHYWGGGHAGSC